MRTQSTSKLPSWAATSRKSLLSTHAISLLALIASALVGVAQESKPAEPPTLAVAEMHGDASSAGPFWRPFVGQELANMLNTELAKLPQFRLLEMVALDDLKKEIKLGGDGWIEQGEANEKGHWKAADFIFRADVTRFGSKTKSWGGSGLSLPRLNLPFGGTIRNVAVESTENDVQIDWRIIDVTSRQIVKSGSSIGREKGTSFGFGSWYDSGSMRTSEFLGSALGKATVKAIAGIMGDLTHYQPPQSARTKLIAKKAEEADLATKKKIEDLRSQSGKVLHAAKDRVFVDVGSKRGFKKGDRLQLLMLEEIKNDAGAVVFTKKRPVGEVVLDEVQEDGSEALYSGSATVKAGWLVTAVTK